MDRGRGIASNRPFSARLRTQSGLALLVVVAILTALFIMGATFAMITRMNQRSGQNLAMNEAARRKAGDQLETAIQLLARTRANTITSATESVIGDSALSDWYTRSDPLLPDPLLPNVNVPQKINTFRIRDEDSKFNLNGHGYPSDLGNEADYRQHYTSFETSLVRVLMAVPGMSGPKGEYPNEDDLRRVCILIAREIAERRYGASRDPDQLSTIPRPGMAGVDEEVLAYQMPGWTIDTSWSAIPALDTGVRIPAGGPIFFGAKDGYPSMWISYVSDPGKVDFRRWYYAQEGNIWRGPSDVAVWNDDLGTGYPDATDDTKEIGWNDSLPSAICDPLTGALMAEPGIGEARTVDDFAEYDPECPIGNAEEAGQEPDNDRAYTSIYQVPAIIQEVLSNPKYENMQADAAWQKAGKIFSLIRPYICVHSHARRGQAAGATPAIGLVSINDWSDDRIDNDGNGILDEDDDDEMDDHQALAERLGLVKWAGDDDGCRQQAAQLVANIIDFRDDGDDPTAVTIGFPNADLTTTEKTAWGCEGLHITKVMGMPSKVLPEGTEFVFDADWRWEAPYYIQDAAAGSTAEWTFPTAPNVLPNGYYALRIYSTLNDKPLTFIYNGNPYLVTTTLGVANDYYGYVRDAAGKLVCVRVQGGNLTFQISAGQGATFKAIQLLPQFIEITNIAMQSPQRDGEEPESHSIDLSGFQLDAGLGAGNEIFVPDKDPWTTDEKAWYWFGDATTGLQAQTRKAPPARGDGTFPVNYGYFVFALSEAAYAMQYGNAATNGGNGDEIWGNNSREDYPVFFVGELGLTTGEKDVNADKFAIPKNATISLLDGPDGSLMAGAIDADNSVDGLFGVPLTDYVVKEKTFVDARLPADWVDYDDPLDPLKLKLWSEQRRPITVIASVLHGQPSNVVIYTNLNSCYDALYHVQAGLLKPGQFKTLDDLAYNSVTLPIILNRPYPSPAWLGLVPSGTKWRTIDPTPDGLNNPTLPEHLLGLLIQNSIVGGFYSRFNLNTASAPVLKSLFDDTTVTRIIQERDKVGVNRPHNCWHNWDELLNDPLVAYYLNSVNPDDDRVGYFGDGLEDSGTGTYADDFTDDSDEREEWFRRYSGLIDIRSTAFQINCVGSVPVPGGQAVAEIEAVVDRDRDTDRDGIADCSLVEFRWVTEQ